MKKYTRTDLACEKIRVEKYGGAISEKIEILDGYINVERMEQSVEDSSFAVEKYVSIECPGMWKLAREDEEKLINLMSRELSSLAEEMTGKKISSDFRVLVAGLGNSDITADAVGPLSVRGICVTRHLRDYDEELFKSLECSEISAVVPGVLGQTGIETVEMIRGAVENAHPDLVIAIDALAAISCERLASIVQISDSGINPGSGIGNLRKKIDRETVGVPVMSVGVPTVVESSTLIYDALHQAGIEKISEALEAVLENGKSFFVSPKEIDLISERVSHIFASAIKSAFGDIPI